MRAHMRATMSALSATRQGLGVPPRPAPKNRSVIGLSCTRTAASCASQAARASTSFSDPFSSVVAGHASDSEEPRLEAAAPAVFDAAHLHSLGLPPAALQLSLHSVGALLPHVDESGTSSVCSHLPLASFLDQTLRTTGEGWLSSPATPLLVISIISRLRFGTAAAAEPYQGLYQRAAGALMESADAAGVYELRNAAVMSADEVLQYFEAVAQMDFPAQVYKGSGYGHLLYYHLKSNRFSPQQLVRLLEAWGALRASNGYNPCTINFRLLTQGLVAAMPTMTSQELLRVVAASRQFEWPVYGGMALLEGACAAASARVASGELPVVTGRRVVESAVLAAAAQRPALGASLRAKLASAGAQRAVAGKRAWAGAGRGGTASSNVVVAPQRKRRPAGNTAAVLRDVTATCLPATAAVLLLAPAMQQVPPLAVLLAPLAVLSLAAAAMQDM